MRLRDVDTRESTAAKPALCKPFFIFSVDIVDDLTRWSLLICSMVVKDLKRGIRNTKHKYAEQIMSIPIVTQTTMPEFHFEDPIMKYLFKKHVPFSNFPPQNKR